MSGQHYHSTGEVCPDPLCQPGVRVLQPRDLTKNHEFLRIWTDEEGNFKSDLNCPPEANAGFGDRTNMEILRAHLIRVSAFVTEVLGAVSTALSDSYMAQVQEALQKGNANAQEGKVGSGRARQDPGDREPHTG